MTETPQSLFQGITKNLTSIDDVDPPTKNLIHQIVRTVENQNNAIRRLETSLVALQSRIEALESSPNSEEV